MDMGRLAPIHDPFILMRSVSHGSPSDPWPQVRDIMDGARAALSDVDFAPVVTSVRRVIVPLIHGRPAEWPSVGPAAGGRLTDDAAAVVREVRATLCLSARHGGPGSSRALAMLGHRIDAHLDDLTAATDR